MSEEHGYQRSGKKCREKFENLYKYYKKTKEGKAGRQDGKHYRFFRQLEALYGGGEANTGPASMSEAAPPHPSLLTASKLSDTSLSLSNYSDADADTSTSDDSDWKVKISDFIDAHMKKMMEKQEEWMEKMMRAMEEKERERAVREEEWRRHDAARIEREREFWAGERAWIESRDAALMGALHGLAGRAATDQNGVWPECEINRLMQMTEGKFEEEMVWEEIASKMACFGHERSAAVCKQKWEGIHNCVTKKSKDYCDQANMSTNPNLNAASGISESCFRYFMGDDYGRIID